MNNSSPANGGAIGNKSGESTKRVATALCLLLAVQVALAIVLRASETKYQPFEPTAPLLKFDLSKISKLVIEESENNGTKSKLVLQKIKDGWLIPEYYNAPGSSVKIDGLLNTLKDLKAGYPTTTSAEAAEHLKVSPGNFVRAISLYDDRQKITSLYLGSSPGFKMVYAKTPSSNNIYAIDLTQTRITTKPEDWIDIGMVKIKQARVTGVDMGSFRVSKVKDQWSLTFQDKTHAMHESVVRGLIDAVTHVPVKSVLGDKPDVAYADKSDMPVLSYKITLSDGSIITYSFFKPRYSTVDVLKVSNNNLYLGVDDWTVNNIEKMSPDSLLALDAREPKESQEKEPPRLPQLDRSK